MRRSRPFTALLLLFVLVLQCAPNAKACGPETLQPIFVFEDSPDPPFYEFTEGKIGIVQPSFGRKTLVIAYRYLTGGSFSAEEQKALVEALKGTPPEGTVEPALKAWLAARKEVAKEEEELPNIYRPMEYGSYDFLPNCTSHAFEVAIETLKDRAGRFGPDDASVREWLSGQDTVFQNCAEGSHLPIPVGADSPVWLRKDRDYQRAAALFYSTQFDEARRSFELIAHDAESDWQQTADYLVARTLVRQASLESDEKVKRNTYERAETYLLSLLSRAGKFRSGTQKLLGLIKYRLRPEERVRELAQIMPQTGNDNLRQDLIDYVWLLDKFDAQVQKEEEERQKLLNPKPDSETPQSDQKQTEQQKNFEGVERGELIQISLIPITTADSQVDQSTFRQFFFKPEVSAREIYETFETSLGRKLSEAEVKQLEERHASSLRWRTWSLSPNRKLNRQDYEGCDYGCNHLTLDLLPSFLRMDQLTDWIFTFQSKDPEAYSHALAKWRETNSDVWFVAALAKARAKESRSLQRLLLKAQMIQPDSPLFATVAYIRVRLLIDLGRRDEARKVLDKIIATKLDTFPMSAQNQFIEQRMQVAENFSEFLRFAARKPIAFYLYGSMGTIAKLMATENDISEQQGIDVNRTARLEELVKWDGRSVFDENVVDVLNWHFPLKGLMATAHDPALPDYLRQRVLLTVWTRAVLLKNDAVAQQAATELVHQGSDPSGVLSEYLKAGSAVQKEDAATFALLKLPSLSPYILPGVPDLDTGDDGYDFALSWWCKLDETTYDEEFKEVPKEVASPSFLPPEFLSAAKKERVELQTIGDGKKYLGRRVIEWARQRPEDPRLPEALFIAVMANLSYKYGCGGWEQDERVREDAASLLRDGYPNSVWALKLREMEQQGWVH